MLFTKIVIFCSREMDDNFEFYGKIYLTKIKTHDDPSATDLLVALAFQGPDKITFSDFSNIVKVVLVFYSIII